MPRMTIEFPKQVDNILKELAKNHSTTKADVLGRALSLYYYVEKETKDKNQKLSITDEEDKVLKDIMYQ